MSTKLARVGLAAIGLTLAVLGIRGILLRFSDESSAPRPVRTANSVEEVNAIRSELARKDDEVLRSEKGTEQEKFTALVRAGRRQDLGARERALAWKADRSPLVRGGAALALGNFDDSISLKALETLLADPDRNVRLHALQALGSRRGEGRQAVLDRLSREADAKPADAEWKARLREAGDRLQGRSR